MKVLAGGCRVCSAEDGDVSTEGNRTARTVISPARGAKRVTQTVSDYTPGWSPLVVNPNAEEVLYVAAGRGSCISSETRSALRPGSAVYIPPGAPYNIENTGPETLRIISSCCPLRAGKTGSPAMVHEDERDEIRAGQDRIFRYLVHTDLGCEQVTQFVGWIPKSKAPFHLHKYEEVIYILEGRGILHFNGRITAATGLPDSQTPGLPDSVPFSPGTSIYLPAGVVHCLENPGPAPVRLLGVFYPSGSPGAAYEND
jgi:mannose-6-phosphate isomerase-like protein (cupin superfamily)